MSEISFNIGVASLIILLVFVYVFMVVVGCELLLKLCHLVPDADQDAESLSWSSVDYPDDDGDEFYHAVVSRPLGGLSQEGQVALIEELVCLRGGWHNVIVLILLQLVSRQRRRKTRNAYHTLCVRRMHDRNPLFPAPQTRRAAI